MSVRVSGAGSAEVNGEYVPDGTFGPKQLPRFRLQLETGQKGDVWIRHWETTESWAITGNAYTTRKQPIYMTKPGVADSMPPASGWLTSERMEGSMPAPFLDTSSGSTTESCVKPYARDQIYTTRKARPNRTQLRAHEARGSDMTSDI